MWLLTLFQESMKMKGPFFSLSFILPDWLQAVRRKWLQDPKILHMIQQLQANSLVSLGYS
jgi:hypothetical protein